MATDEDQDIAGGFGAAEIQRLAERKLLAIYPVNNATMPRGDIQGAIGGSGIDDDRFRTAGG